MVSDWASPQEFEGGRASDEASLLGSEGGEASVKTSWTHVSLSPHQHHSDLNGYAFTIGIMDAGGEISLIVVGSCGMNVPPSGAFDTNGSPH